MGLNYSQIIKELFQRDLQKVAILNIIQSIELPDCLIAAGFVRNTIWNWQFDTCEPLSDIDVIYFCNKDTSEQRDKLIESRLLRIDSKLPWSVKNQARMHFKNNDQAYSNTLDAMSYWPEKQTALGIKLGEKQDIEIKHCFDLAFQFNQKVSHNPNCSKAVFLSRVRNKRWTDKWPALSVEH